MHNDFFKPAKDLGAGIAIGAAAGLVLRAFGRFIPIAFIFFAYLAQKHHWLH